MICGMTVTTGAPSRLAVVSRLASRSSLPAAVRATPARRALGTSSGSPRLSLQGWVVDRRLLGSAGAGGGWRLAQLAVLGQRHQEDQQEQGDTRENVGVADDQLESVPAQLAVVATGRRPDHSPEPPGSLLSFAPQRRRPGADNGDDQDPEAEP